MQVYMCMCRRYKPDVVCLVAWAAVFVDAAVAVVVVLA